MAVAASSMSSRSTSTSGRVIDLLLGQLENLSKVGVLHSRPTDEIDGTLKRGLKAISKIPIRIPPIRPPHVRLKLHHEIHIAPRRIERPLRGRPEHREALDVVLHAQRPNLVEVIGDRGG